LDRAVWGSARHLKKCCSVQFGPLEVGAGCCFRTVAGAFGRWVKWWIVEIAGSGQIAMGADRMVDRWRSCCPVDVMLLLEWNSARTDEMGHRI
ncbi:hypothetical protein ACLOJK_026860, partial [Asimina triloba]